MIAIDRRTIVQFVKFNIVGLVNTALATAVYIAVVYVTDSYTAALISDYSVGIALGFVLNKRWTFEQSAGLSVRALARYVVVYAVVFALNYGLLGLAVDGYGYDPYVAQLAIFAVIIAPIFLIQKRYVFITKGVPS